ncbi:MAG: DUF2461 domain-containing protein [Bacteroidia bacterium]
MRIPALFQFLSDLKTHNSKDWFDANRKEYQLLREEFLLFISEVLIELGKIDDRFSAMNPSKCIFRINRDIRFSKNKDPYKTNFGMNLNLSGSKDFFCGMYLHLEPENTFFAGGTYLPPPAILQSIRQEIDYNSNDFKKIVESKTFIKVFGGITGDTLSRPPKGYEADNEMIKFIKLKSFIAEKKFSEIDISSDQLKDLVVEYSKLIMPLNNFLLTANNH